MSALQITLVVVLILAIVGFAALFWWTNRNHALVTESRVGPGAMLLNPDAMAALMVNTRQPTLFVSNPNPTSN